MTTLKDKIRDGILEFHKYDLDYDTDKIEEYEHLLNNICEVIITNFK